MFRNIMKLISFRSLPAVIATVFYFISTIFILVSCRPAAEFGELFICSSIDEESSAPATPEDQFSVDTGSIYATISVSGVKSDDTWRFTWKNAETGYVLADSANIYSREGTGYMEGYLSSRLIPHGNDPVIGEPGDYIVEFYHNGELKASSGFTIKEPAAGITGVMLSGGVDEEGNPSDIKSEFYQDETVYASVALDYRIPGDHIEAIWSRSGGELLEKSSFTIEEACYVPGNLEFQISNKEPWPIGDYRIEVMLNGKPAAGETFKIIPYGYQEEVLKEFQVYENTGYGFRINYPHSWSLEESEEGSGLRVSFNPDNPAKNFVINMWVYRDGYYPAESELSGFSDGLLQGVIEPEPGEQPDYEKKESQGKTGDIPFMEVEYQHDGGDGVEGWNAAFSFIVNNKKMYILFRVSDIHYLEYAGEACMDMRDSIEFLE